MTTADILRWMPVIIEILAIILREMENEETGYDDPGVV